MVHQLSLVSTVPHNSYVQTISTLQALTGLTSPQNISTYSLICKPINKYKPKFEPGKVNQIEQYYMRCTTTWDDLDSFPLESPYLDTRVSSSKLFESDAQSSKIWTLQISDIPIAGKNQVCCAQNIFESTVVHTHTSAGLEDAVAAVKQETTEKTDDLMEIEPKSKDAEKSDDLMEIEPKPKENKLQKAPVEKDSFVQFLEDLGYGFINQFWVKGVRFFHGDTVIEIFKVFVRDDANTEHPPNQIPLKLLDESNSFQIRAFINVAKSTDIDLINQGSKELLKLQDFLKNLIKLEIPDRIYMDSRVPSI